MEKARAEKLFADIGRALFHDADRSGEDWDAVSIVAVVDDGFVDLTGYRYEGAEAGPIDWTAENMSDLILGVHAATQDEDTRPWKVMYYGIIAETGKYIVRFEYEAADRWAMTPDNFDTLPTALNPLNGEPP